MPILSLATPEAWFIIKMSSYQHRKSHEWDKMILRPSYLHSGISYTGKMVSLYWIKAQSLSYWQSDDNRMSSSQGKFREIQDRAKVWVVKEFEC